ncbi:MAG: fibronectin type III domain-containing protein, partial [Desulfobacterales bacterium]|nr:fibronectin type III domain-containing protein [Desulfobacterales bacterium]
WDSHTSTLEFTSTGTISFDKSNHWNHYWDVPKSVKRIFIHANVTVTGCFHTYASCTIEGADRTSSVIFGTNEQNWANNRNISAYKYSQIENKGGTLYVRNLTMYNPLSYFIRGSGGNKICHAHSLDLIDDRGGWGNHSDGFVGADGSTIDDCYMETGDDAIKAYFDIKVTNTTIKMVQNCVPIQIGWHSHGTVHATFENFTVIGDKGRGSDKGIIASHGSAGNTKLNLTIKGCFMNNPNAALFDLENNGDVVSGSITDARIDVEHYRSGNKGTSPITICGTSTQRNDYTCGTVKYPPTFPRRVTATATSGRFIELRWDDVSLVEEDFQIQRLQANEEDWSDIAILAANNTRYTDRSLADTDNVLYRIRARNSQGASAWSNLTGFWPENPEGDSLPWIEDFTSISDQTLWHASYGRGQFGTTGGQFLISDTDGERTLTSEWINISTASSVDISAWVRSQGSMETGMDFLDLYYQIDDGPEIAIANFDAEIDNNNPAGQTLSVTGISGNKLRLIIRGTTSISEEVYTIDDVSVIAPPPPSGRR